MKEKWTYEKCKEIALRFDNRKELKKNFYQVHYKIYKKKWYELISHMKREASKRERCVYYYKFNNGGVYVGITCNHKRRDIQHHENGPVYDYSLKTLEKIPPMILLTDYIDFNDAAYLEIKIIDILSKEKNITLLNKERGGGLGSWCAEKVTKEQCIQDIKKCSNKTQLLKRYYSSYLFLRENLEKMDEEYQNFFKGNHTYTKVVSFDKNGNFFKIFNKIADAMIECGSKQVSEACREHYYTNGFYFMYYNEWEKNGKPLKISSKEEKNKIAQKNTIIHRNEYYEKNGNPQKGKNKSIEHRKKLSTPLVMTDLNNNFIDVVDGLSFAVEKYSINENLKKGVTKAKNNPNKSAYGYRWYTIDFYNKTFNKNIKYGNS